MIKRMEDVEVKLAFMENALAELDDVVRGLSNQVDALRVAVVGIRESLQADAEGLTGSGHEPPPHY